MSAVTVGVAPPAAEQFSLAQRAVWASLPMSLTPAAGNARLVAVDGRRPGWLEAVADLVRSGIAGVLVVHPTVVPAAPEVRAVAASAIDAHVPVVVQTAWASHPTVARFGRPVAQRVADPALIDSVAVTTDDDPRSSADVLLDQLALLRAVSRAPNVVRFAAEDLHGYTMVGGQGPTTVALSAVRSATARPGARLALYGTSSESHLSVPTDPTAAPATAWFLGPAGKSVQPSWYESASRACWLRLYHAVTGTATVSDLALLACDFDLVAAAFTDPPQR
jgi:hypothetical protein